MISMQHQVKMNNRDYRDDRKLISNRIAKGMSLAQIQAEVDDPPKDQGRATKRFIDVRRRWLPT
jgi:hypothetical protein